MLLFWPATSCCALCAAVVIIKSLYFHQQSPCDFCHSSGSHFSCPHAWLCYKHYAMLLSNIYTHIHSYIVLLLSLAIVTPTVYTHTHTSFRLPNIVSGRSTTLVVVVVVVVALVIVFRRSYVDRQRRTGNWLISVCQSIDAI